MTVAGARAGPLGPEQAMVKWSVAEVGTVGASTRGLVARTGAAHCSGAGKELTAKWPRFPSSSLRQQERVLEELRLVRSDIGDFRADMEVQSAIVRRLDQSVQSLTGEVRALAAQQDRQRQRLERLQGLLAPTSGEPA